ncbi:MAG: group 1 truncated hemoglobin [Caulobacteraceae bacterium]|nr:group 1 truncated hemoglobin [Caulobacteraceae bacterium]
MRPLAKPLCAAALAAFTLGAGQAHAQPSPWSIPGEEAVKPYEVSPANAGAQPISDPRVLAAFHGRDGISRIVDAFVELSFTDPRIAPIFKPFDRVRLTRTLNEQLCYLLGGDCAHSGRHMASAHRVMGVGHGDMNALAESLQTAMDREGELFAMRNRLLPRLDQNIPDIVAK